MLTISKIPKIILARHHLFAVFLVLLSLILGSLSTQFPWFSDLTQDQRNSLSGESIDILQSMKEPIEIQAMVSSTSIKGKYFRKSILNFIARYQRYKNNITVTFLSPVSDMTKASKIGLSQEGDWRITYKNQSEFFKLPYTEEHFTNLLKKLQSGKLRTFFLTDGHLEPRFEDMSNNGWQHLSNTLINNGIELKQSATLANVNQDHILVIGAPRKPFSQHEVAVIQQHIKQGGNLIWVIDSPNLQGLDGLANLLNIKISPGVVVDLSNEQYGVDPRTVTASNYARHEIFSDFAIRTVFPNARRISQNGNIDNNWKYTQLIGVAENGWLTNQPPQKLTRNELSKNIGEPGPINIALALERTVKNQQQRILVIGGSDFLSNQTIDNGGNSILALRMFKWTVASYAPVTLKTNLRKDSVAIIANEPINRYLIMAIFNGFQFLLPALLFLVALFVWYRRS
jgi:hypothetical protein